jgi:hypothetical protein
MTASVRGHDVRQRGGTDVITYLYLFCVESSVDQFWFATGASRKQLGSGVVSRRFCSDAGHDVQEFRQQRRHNHI